MELSQSDKIVTQPVINEAVAKTSCFPKTEFPLLPQNPSRGRASSCVSPSNVTKMATCCVVKLNSEMALSGKYTTKDYKEEK